MFAYFRIICGEPNSNIDTSDGWSGREGYMRGGRLAGSNTTDRVARDFNTQLTTSLRLKSFFYLFLKPDLYFLDKYFHS